MRVRSNSPNSPAGSCPSPRPRARLAGTAAACVALAALLTGTAATAAESAATKPRTALGVAVVALKSPYAGYRTDTLAAPVGSWEGKSFYFRGGTLGYRLLDNQHTEVSVMVSPYMMRFKHNDSDDMRLRQLSNRNFSAMAGVAVRHNAAWGLLQADVQREISGHGGGLAADAKYAYPLPVGRVTLVPGVGASYASSRLNDYYFGVGAAEAARSGLARYRAGSGVAPYVDLLAVMPLGPRWTATASLRRTLLSDAVDDSPMTDADHMDSAALSLSYGF